MKKNLLSLILISTIILSGLFVEASIEENAIIFIDIINQDPDPAFAGSTFEIRLGISNRGGKDSENLIIEFEPDYPFYIIPGENNLEEVGIIRAYQGRYTSDDMKIIKFKVGIDQNAETGEHDFNIKYRTENSKITTQKTFKIDIRSKEIAEIIHIDKTTLIPGQQEELKFIINNLGNSPIKDISFSWINEDNIILPVSGDNTKHIRNINIGENQEIVYQVMADTNAQAGLYKLDLSLKYFDSITGDERTLNTIAGMYVGGKTDFDVTLSEITTTQTILSIANIGSNPAFSVSVIIPQQQNWVTSESNSMIIGNLNKGDYTIASFNLQSSSRSNQGNNTSQRGERIINNERTTNINNETNENSNSQSLIKEEINNVNSNSLNVQIAYTDTQGNRNIIEKKVLITPTTTSSSFDISQRTNFGQRTTQQKSFFSKYKWHLIIVLILTLSLIYYNFRKRKLIEPNLTLKKYFGL